MEQTPSRPAAFSMPDKRTAEASVSDRVSSARIISMGDKLANSSDIDNKVHIHRFIFLPPGMMYSLKGWAKIFLGLIIDSVFVIF